MHHALDDLYEVAVKELRRLAHLKQTRAFSSLSVMSCSQCRCDSRVSERGVFGGERGGYVGQYPQFLLCPIGQGEVARLKREVNKQRADDVNASYGEKDMAHGRVAVSLERTLAMAELIGRPRKWPGSSKGIDSRIASRDVTRRIKVGSEDVHAKLRITGL